MAWAVLVGYGAANRIVTFTDVALVVVFGSIGYLLRADGGSVDRTPSPTDTSV